MRLNNNNFLIIQKAKSWIFRDENSNRNILKDILTFSTIEIEKENSLHILSNASLTRIKQQRSWRSWLLALTTEFQIEICNVYDRTRKQKSSETASYRSKQRRQKGEGRRKGDSWKRGNWRSSLKWSSKRHHPFLSSPLSSVTMHGVDGR